MKNSTYAKQVLIGVTVLLVLGGTPLSAQTDGGNQCLSQLANCYYWAAAQAAFWVMWAAGIDCELAAVDCIRRAVLGR